MTSPRRTPAALAALLLIGTACSGDTKTTETIKTEIPACSASYPAGTCDAGSSCFQGACVATASLCSPTNLAGTCASGLVCYGGGCVLPSVVPPTTPTLDCTVKVNTVQPVLGFAPAKPTKAAGAAYTYNNGTATVEVPYTQKAEITVDGLKFRDLNGNGTLDKYEDWRYPEICRAQDLVTKMTVPQKVGLMNSGGTLGNGSADGVISDSIVQNIAGANYRQGLTRGGFTAPQMGAYFNNVQALCEGLPLGIPAIVSSDPVHYAGGSMAATGVMTVGKSATWSYWTGTLGLGAINDADLTRRHAECTRREFMAAGIRWQLGPMADIATEPRWGRVTGLFGSQSGHVAKHTVATVIGFQGSANGDLRHGIAATMKHFPGHGAQADGMDAHTVIGRFNVYPGDNLSEHFVPFKAAFDVGAAAIMPCYSVFKDQWAYDPMQIPSGFSKELVTGLAKNTLGFTGMVTGDWGTATGQAFNMEMLTAAERAALWLDAGSHQYGSDSNAGFQQAFDQGLVTQAQIDETAAKILEMTFKVGAFENPYVDLAATANEARSAANRTDGFESMKKAIVILKNADHATSGVRYLPINGTRYADKAGGTTGAPDAGEFACDTNGNGTVEVYYDGVWDSIVSPTDPTKQDDMTDLLAGYDYQSAGAGAAGAAGYTLPVAGVATLAEADIAIIRIVPRASARTWEGLLSYDGVLTPAELGWQVDTSLDAAAASKKKVIDALRARDGYVNSAGTAVAATRPNLKIILVQYMSRPAIVRPFIQGLVSLNETPGVAGSYPSVSNEANINQGTTLTGVDALLADFGAWDRAVLDFVFNKNVPAGFTYGAARLPFEIPNSDAAARAQFEDVPNDSMFPTYYVGAGSALPAN